MRTRSRQRFWKLGSRADFWPPLHSSGLTWRWSHFLECLQFGISGRSSPYLFSSALKCKALPGSSLWASVLSAPSKPQTFHSGSGERWEQEEAMKYLLTVLFTSSSVWDCPNTWLCIAVMLQWGFGVVLPANQWVDKELFVVPYLTARKAEEEILLVGKDFLSDTHLG